MSFRSEATDADVEEVWDDFWVPLFRRAKEDGVDLIWQLKCELFDYRRWMRNWSDVAAEISGGMLSKINYAPDVYINAFNERVAEAYQEGYEDAKREMLDEQDAPVTDRHAPVQVTFRDRDQAIYVNLLLAACLKPWPGMESVTPPFPFTVSDADRRVYSDAYNRIGEALGPSGGG